MADIYYDARFGVWCDQFGNILHHSVMVHHQPVVYQPQVVVAQVAEQTTMTHVAHCVVCGQGTQYGKSPSGQYVTSRKESFPTNTIRCANPMCCDPGVTLADKRAFLRV